jgi:enterochelin esterase-like enzyme
MLVRALFSALLLLAMPAAAQPPAEPAPGYTVPNSAVHRIKAEALGRDYDLTVLLPPSYASSPERRYPVLFTTDAPQSMLMMRAYQQRLRSSERGMEDAIIVGLGYAVGDSGTYSRRRDYTPSPNGDIDAASDKPGVPVKYGEAEGYRLHLKDEVFPFLESRYRIDPKRRIYAGHSYGGLFGTHVLLTEPALHAGAAKLRITTQPAHAEVYLDGKLRGVDASGHDAASAASVISAAPSIDVSGLTMPKACSILDPTCEACQ